MYRLLVAATAITFSLGCQAVWSIFLLKSRLSTLISSFFRLPPVDTLRGFSVARGLLLSRDASSVMSRRVLRSNIRKKLLYDPVMMALREKRERERERESLFTLDTKAWCQTQRGIQTSKSTVRMVKGSREKTKEGVL